MLTRKMLVLGEELDRSNPLRVHDGERRVVLPAGGEALICKLCRIVAQQGIEDEWSQADMVMSLAGSVQAQKGPLSEELVCALTDIDRGVNGQSNLVLWDATLWEWTPGIRGHSPGWGLRDCL